MPGAKREHAGSKREHAGSKREHAGSKREHAGSKRERGVGVSMPYTDGKHSLAKLQVSISKLQVSISEIKQYFHHDIWAAASCCGLQLQCG